MNPRLKRDLIAAVWFWAGIGIFVGIFVRAPQTDLSIALHGMCASVGISRGIWMVFTNKAGGPAWRE